MASLPAANPATLPIGFRPGNLAYYGDSLTATNGGQSVLLQQITNWWKFLSVPLKREPTGNAVFGWGVNPNGLAASNIAQLATSFDATAPWNCLVTWLEAADIVRGDSGVTVYASIQTMDALLAAVWPVRFYVNMLAAANAAPAQIERDVLNNLLVTSPIGTGTIDVRSYPGTPNTPPYFLDSRHMTTQGQGWVARNCFDSVIRSWLATL